MAISEWQRFYNERDSVLLLSIELLLKNFTVFQNSLISLYTCAEAFNMIPKPCT